MLARGEGIRPNEPIRGGTEPTIYPYIRAILGTVSVPSESFELSEGALQLQENSTPVAIVRELETDRSIVRTCSSLSSSPPHLAAQEGRKEEDKNIKEEHQLSQL